MDKLKDISLSINDTLSLMREKIIYGKIKYDWIHKLLYVHDERTINVMNIEFPKIRYTVIESLYIEEFLVNPIDSVIIWSEKNSKWIIKKANQDGSDPVVLYSSFSIKDVRHITADYEIRRIYWFDNEKKSLASVDFEGRYEKEFFKSISLMNQIYPLDIDVYRNFIYFATSTFIVKLDLINNSNKTFDLRNINFAKYVLTRLFKLVLSFSYNLF